MNISISEVQELKSIQCNVQVADSKQKEVDFCSMCN